MATRRRFTQEYKDQAGLSNALDRERARYHERQATLLARVLRGKPKPAPR